MLGSNVVDRSHPLTIAGRARPLIDQPRDPEVRQIGVFTVEQDVGGFDIAMHQATSVRGVEGPPDLVGDAGGLGCRQAAPGTEQRLQVGAVDVPDDQIQVPVLFAGRVDGDHVGVVDRRHQPCLTLKAPMNLRVAGLLVDYYQLDRHRAIKRRSRAR